MYIICMVSRQIRNEITTKIKSEMKLQLMKEERKYEVTD